MKQTSQTTTAEYTELYSCDACDRRVDVDEIGRGAMSDGTGGSFCRKCRRAEDNFIVVDSKVWHRPEPRSLGRISGYEL